jgi:hypothetical protein
MDDAPPRAAGSLPNLVFIGAAALAGLVALGAIASFLAHRREAGVAGMALFLACFSLVKFAVMVRSITETVNPDGSDARELYGTPGRFKLYVASKGLAGAVALGGAIYILVHGAPHLG